ncbi:MAG: peptide ABC transporter substrate-binding protein [Bdellovibrionales bacterium]|nr:peptide ABC transporter substrate-binding protein [Bdellovibrionales bacterium]
MNMKRLVFVFLATASIAQAAPKKVNLVIQTEPPQLDSSKATDQQSNFVLGHILEGLTRSGKNGEPLPGVAEKWEVNDKGATFYLRKDAKWSDGKPVTAKDFVFAWRLAVDPKNTSEYAFILYPVKNAEAIVKGKKKIEELGATAVNDTTLKVEFEKPCGYFLGLTSFTTYLPIREDFYKSRNGKYGADAKDLLANGPFTLTRWVHGASLTMEKNPNYWNAKTVKLDQIDIPYITPDNTAQFNFFKDKKVDMIERLGKDDLPLATKNGFKMKSYSDGSVFYMEFNFRKGRPTTNKNLRKAIQLVVNMDEYITKVVGIPGTLPGKTLIPVWVRGVKDRFRKEYPYNPPKMNIAEAKKFVEAAKKELGGSIPPLVWLTGDTNFAAREAEYFQNIFKTHLGLELKIDKQIFKQRLAKMTAGEFDIVAAGWGPDFADPMTFAELKTSWNENNRGEWKNDQYDKLIREAQSTSSVKKRMNAMAAAEKIMLDEVAIVPSYERTVIYIENDRLKGVVRKQIGADPDLTQATID